MEISTGGNTFLHRGIISLLFHIPSPVRYYVIDKI